MQNSKILHKKMNIDLALLFLCICFAQKWRAKWQFSGTRGLALTCSRSPPRTPSCAGPVAAKTYAEKISGAQTERPELAKGSGGFRPATC
jgi:hypothetical protein